MDPVGYQDRVHRELISHAAGHTSKRLSRLIKRTHCSAVGGTVRDPPRRRTRGRRLATLRQPFGWPLSRPSCFLSQTDEIGRLLLPFADVSRRYGRPKRSGCEGERRPRRLKVGTQGTVCAGPCRGVAPPRWSGSSRPLCIGRAATTDHSRAGHPGDNVPFRRCPFSHTPRGPRFLAVSSTKSAAAARSLGRPSGRLTRGERRPLRRRTSPQYRSTPVPPGTSLPHVRSSRLEAGSRPRSLRTNSIRACSITSRFRALRAPLRDLDVISARPSNGFYRSELSLVPGASFAINVP
jgi:hypothetical protein